MSSNKNVVEVVSVKDSTKTWLRLQGRNGETILSSELYSSLSATRKAAKRIYKDLSKIEWEIKEIVIS